MRVDIDMHETVEAVTKIVPRGRDAAVIARSLAKALHTQWKNEAAGGLGGSSTKYVAELGLPEEISPGHMAVTLGGTFPNMLEQGWPGPIDLRSTIIPNAKNKRVSKEGYEYVSIPFRHGSSGSAGRAGKPMPRPIHNVAKELTSKVSQHGARPFHQRPGGIDTVLRPGMSHVNAKRVSKAAAHYLETKAQPWHQSSVYAGMIREQKTYENSTQPQYKTFRTITTNPGAATPTGDPDVDKNKWMHPGIEPHNFGQRAMDRLTRGGMELIIENAIRHDNG